MRRLVAIGFVAHRLPSKQTLFLWGLFVLALTTLGFAASRTLVTLVVARVLQGLSSAIVFGVGFAILYDVVGPERMGSVSGWTSFAISLGSLSGPVLGGVLYESFGYFHVFLPALALLVLDMVMRFMYRPGKSIAPSAQEEPRASGCAAPPSIAKPLGTNLPQAPAEAPAARTENEPLLSRESGPPPSRPPDRDCQNGPESALRALLSTPRFVTAVLAALHLCGVPAGLDATLPVYLREAFGLSSAQTAPFFTLIGAPLLLAPLAGLASDRLGPRPPAALALALQAAALLGLRAVAPGLAAWRPTLLALLGAVGFGVTLGLPPLTADVGRVVAALEAARPERGSRGGAGTAAQAYGLFNAATALGSVVGPLFGGFVKDRLGWAWATSSLGWMAVGLFMLVVLFTGGDLIGGRSRWRTDNWEEQTGPSIRGGPSSC